MHAAPHAMVPDGHVVTHAREAHSAPAPQAMPQAPQFAGSDVMSVQVPAQRLCPTPHWHSPAMQCSPPVHAAPQAPQCASLLRRSTHAPVHTVSPGEHPVAVHVPVEHTSPVAHRLPQAPQCAGSDAVLTHTPLQSVWSGSAHDASGTSGTSSTSRPSGASIASKPRSPETSPMPSGRSPPSLEPWCERAHAVTESASQMTSRGLRPSSMIASFARPIRSLEEWKMGSSGAALPYGAT